MRHLYLKETFMAMAIELLQRLRCSQLPLIVDTDTEISQCLLLRSQRLIDADLPPLRRGQGKNSTYAGHAIVMRITEQGYTRLDTAIDAGKGTIRGH